MIEQAFTETCKETGIQITSDYITYCEERDFESGYQSTMKILSKDVKPTALFVMDSRNVGGVLKACKMAELKVPRDMEILVFGDNEYFEYSEPSLTTIQQPMELFTERSLNRMLVLIKNKTEPPMVQELKPILHFRESCGGFDGVHSLFLG